MHILCSHRNEEKLKKLKQKILAELPEEEPLNEIPKYAYTICIYCIVRETRSN